MKKLVSYTLVGLLTVGALGAVSVLAQTDTTPQPTDTTTAQEMQDPAIQGSIPLNQDPMAQYLTLAKVSMADAVAAAQKAVGTTEGATSASLEDENGYLVWQVVVAGQEVKVDAGTAEVLAQAAVNAKEMENGNEQGDYEQGGNEQMDGNGEDNNDEQNSNDQMDNDSEQAGEQGGEGNN
jgi:hypothetical protein